MTRLHNTSTPTVVVLMAVYNGDKTVEQSITSVLEQSYRDFVFIIVDDGSTDETARILRKMSKQDERIKIIVNPRNLGFPASLNVGWTSTDAEFIALNDSDDISLPNRLEAQLAFMQMRPDIDVLGTGIIMISRDGAELGSASLPEDHETLADRIYRENPFFHPTVMFRRRYLETLNGYDVKLRRVQDCDLWFRGYTQFTFHNLQTPLVRYRMPGKPRWDSVYWASYVLLRAAWREGKIFSKGWYAIRALLAQIAYRSGILKPGYVRRSQS